MKKTKQKEYYQLRDFTTGTCDNPTIADPDKQDLFETLSEVMTNVQDVFKEYDDVTQPIVIYKLTPVMVLRKQTKITVTAKKL